MESKKIITIEKQDVKKELLFALERGIDDVEHGRELPLKSAM
jgi:hypothetical protein